MAYRNGGLDSWDIPSDPNPGKDGLTYATIAMLLIAISLFLGIGVWLSM